MAISRKVVIVAVAVVAVAIALRAALPLAVAHYVNNQLARMGEYRGHVAEVDLAVVRGAYTLHELTVIKERGNTEQPFLTLLEMDISVEWSALFKGDLLGEVRMLNPVVNMIQGETDEDTQLGAGVNWPNQVQRLFPFRFNRVEVTGGNITFRAPGIEANESLTLGDVAATLTNLTNMENRQEPTFAEFDLRARFGENAPVSLSGHINPNAEQPTFDVNLAIEGARLVDTNRWLEEFFNVDAERGVFSMYAELAAADGRFEGYIKPLLENAEIFRIDEPSDNVLQKAWEALVEVVSEVLENPEEEQVATQIPFAGEVENPEAGMLAAAVNLLRNAFIAAFTHSLEGTVSIEDVESGESGR